MILKNDNNFTVILPHRIQGIISPGPEPLVWRFTQTLLSMFDRPLTEFAADAGQGVR
jgi:hypothetical protein